VSVLAADYPFLDVLWTILIIFAWVIWFWMLIIVISDVFRRRDIGGGKKTIWLIFIIFLPFIGVFAYLIANSDGMAQRNAQRAQADKAVFDDYVRTVATTGESGGPASEIDRAKQLLDSGAITQDEFNAIKAKALAT
jgi:Phospholipase_D-nuclease N-terminal/Short C-terminal domain